MESWIKAESLVLIPVVSVLDIIYFFSFASWGFLHNVSIETLKKSEISKADF